VSLIGSTTLTLAVTVEIADAWEEPCKENKRNNSRIALFIMEKELN
jgi:hypothetical protein